MMRAFLDGWGRVGRATWLVVGLWLSTLLLALPLALVLHQMIGDHLGASLMADQAARGVNLDWWNEFLGQGGGIGQTFVPAIIGFAAVMKNMGDLADAQTLVPALTGVVGVQVVLSIFLAGGVLDRLARDRAVGAHAFFAACGVWFWRFLRLGLVAGAAYLVLFSTVHHWFFETLYPRWTRDVSVERTAFVYRAGLYMAFAILVCAVNLLMDYAKVRAVVEDRRSMIGALVAGARFVVRHPRQTVGLYLLNLVAWLAVVAVYFLIAPDQGGGLLAFAIGQLYIVLRVMVRLQFVASQAALFQSKLAHAGYVARPVPKWPDSPAAEAVLERRD
jgi:hypothetical protein